jgi:hypothetical protein
MGTGVIHCRVARSLLPTQFGCATRAASGFAAGQGNAILYIDTVMRYPMPNFFPIDLDPVAPDQLTDGETSAHASARMHVKMFRTADDAITEASTDIELAREFIAHGELSPKSVQNTQKELYRFLTWCREESRQDPGAIECRRPERLQGLPPESAAGVGVAHQVAAHRSALPALHRTAIGPEPAPGHDRREGLAEFRRADRLPAPQSGRAGAQRAHAVGQPYHPLPEPGSYRAGAGNRVGT